MIIQRGRRSGHELFRLMAKARGEIGEAVVVFWGGFTGGWPRSKTRHSDIYLLFGEENKENNEYFDLKMLWGYSSIISWWIFIIYISSFDHIKKIISIWHLNMMGMKMWLKRTFPIKHNINTITTISTIINNNTYNQIINKHPT